MQGYLAGSGIEYANLTAACLRRGTVDQVWKQIRGRTIVVETVSYFPDAEPVSSVIVFKVHGGRQLRGRPIVIEENLSCGFVAKGVVGMESPVLSVPEPGRFSRQRQVKDFLVEQLARLRFPLGLLHFWQLLPPGFPVNFKCHKHVLNCINMPQLETDEAANFLNMIRT